MQSLAALHVTPADRLPETSSSPLIDAMCDPAARNMKKLTLQGWNMTEADAEAILRLLHSRPGFQGLHVAVTVDQLRVAVAAALRLACGARAAQVRALVCSVYAGALWHYMGDSGVILGILSGSMTE